MPSHPSSLPSYLVSNEPNMNSNNIISIFFLYLYTITLISFSMCLFFSISFSLFSSFSLFLSLSFSLSLSPSLSLSLSLSLFIYFSLSPFLPLSPLHLFFHNKQFFPMMSTVPRLTVFLFISL